MGKAHKETYNERLVIETVSIPVYFNENITPVDPRRFSPIGDGKVTTLCPFHKDTDPSFHYWKPKKLFRCFGCGKAGDVIFLHQLFSKMYKGVNYTRDEALESLAKMYNVTIERDEKGNAVKENPFESARYLLLNPKSIAVPKGVITLAEFRKMDRTISRFDMSLAMRVENYANLDMLTASSIMEAK